MTNFKFQKSTDQRYPALLCFKLYLRGLFRTIRRGILSVAGREKPGISRSKCELQRTIRARIVASDRVRVSRHRRKQGAGHDLRAGRKNAAGQYAKNPERRQQLSELSEPTPDNSEVKSPGSVNHQSSGDSHGSPVSIHQLDFSPPASLASRKRDNDSRPTFAFHFIPSSLVTRNSSFDPRSLLHQMQNPCRDPNRDRGLRVNNVCGTLIGGQA
jgi:hypothetical protein